MAARLHAATDGNPLALLELPALLSAEQLEGDARVDEPLPAGRTVQDAYLRRVEHLPADTRRALVLVAAAADEELAPIVAGLAGLGLDVSALQPAEDDALLAVDDGKARFRHPLVRSVVYQAAPASDRRAAHAAIAHALERHGDGDRSARHLAAAAIGPDEALAARLGEAGSRARDRTAYLAAADAFESAARLSPERLARGSAWRMPPRRRGPAARRAGRPGWLTRRSRRRTSRGSARGCWSCAAGSSCRPAARRRLGRVS